MLGDSVAEFSSCFYLSLRYFLDRKNIDNKTGRLRPPYKITPTLLRIVSPIAGGRYLNSFLRTVENIIVPMCLVSSGLTNENALSAFGMIKGMALPLLLFPAGLLSSVTSLLVPEMSEAAAAGKGARIRYAAERSITLTFIAAIPFTVGFYLTAEPLTMLIYSEPSAGMTVRLLAPLVPLMYIDSVADALLKSLDEQLVTFRHSLFDSVGRIAAILLVLPRFGFIGFIAVMYASNLFTALLNLIKLIKVSKAKISLLKCVFLPVAAALTGGLIADTLLGIAHASGLVYIILVFAGISILYVPLLPTFIGRKN
ncbi:MAG: polysaccharide biosynthesis C-terminal domain-containing protein [Clostridia bacterium]|nr:polysaccharide biosynthesis C-terminal domain-containing protein [Clostridia bacterium]